MNDYWNDPPEVDDGIRVCPKCQEEIGPEAIVKSEPITYDEEVLPKDFSLDYDGPWPPPGTTYITVQNGSKVTYKCSCGNEFLG